MDKTDFSTDKEGRRCISAVFYVMPELLRQQIENGTFDKTLLEDIGSFTCPFPIYYITKLWDFAFHDGTWDSGFQKELDDGTRRNDEIKKIWKDYFDIDTDGVKIDYTFYPCDYYYENGRGYHLMDCKDALKDLEESGIQEIDIELFSAATLYDLPHVEELLKQGADGQAFYNMDENKYDVMLLPYYMRVNDLYSSITGNLGMAPFTKNHNYDFPEAIHHLLELVATEEVMFLLEKYGAHYVDEDGPYYKGMYDGIIRDNSRITRHFEKDVFTICCKGDLLDYSIKNKTEQMLNIDNGCIQTLVGCEYNIWCLPMYSTMGLKITKKAASEYDVELSLLASRQDVAMMYRLFDTTRQMFPQVRITTSECLQQFLGENGEMLMWERHCKKMAELIGEKSRFVKFESINLPFYFLPNKYQQLADQNNMNTAVSHAFMDFVTSQWILFDDAKAKPSLFILRSKALPGGSMKDFNQEMRDFSYLKPCVKQVVVGDNIHIESGNDVYIVDDDFLSVMMKGVALNEPIIVEGQMIIDVEVSHMFHPSGEMHLDVLKYAVDTSILRTHGFIESIIDESGQHFSIIERFAAQVKPKLNAFDFHYGKFPSHRYVGRNTRPDCCPVCGAPVKKLVYNASGYHVTEDEIYGGCYTMFQDAVWRCERCQSDIYQGRDGRMGMTFVTFGVVDYKKTGKCVILNMGYNEYQQFSSIKIGSQEERNIKFTSKMKQVFKKGSLECFHQTLSPCQYGQYQPIGNTYYLSIRHETEWEHCIELDDTLIERYPLAYYILRLVKNILSDKDKRK